MNTNNHQILATPAGADYALLDSGDGEKLERYGQILVARPDPQALWPKRLPIAEWKKADAFFSRDAKQADWKLNKNVPERWEINLAGLKFWIKPTSFKHVGLFPEQASNWQWIQERIKNAGRPINVLNLFAYTGGASLAAAAAGASVTHVDGSKTAVTWARANASLSGLAQKPIRWILDDVREFVQREIKRGVRYDGIILDPPAFGHGPKKELWKIEEDFVPFLKTCRAAMSEQPLFFLLNGYASGYSAQAYKNNLLDLFAAADGTIEVGELVLAEQVSENKSAAPRVLPAGIFARWSAQ